MFKIKLWSAKISRAARSILHGDNSTLSHDRSLYLICPNTIQDSVAIMGFVSISFFFDHNLRSYLYYITNKIEMIQLKNYKKNQGSGADEHHVSRADRLVADLRQLLTLKQHYYPEGGWGWVILIVGVLVHILSHGLLVSYGLFYLETVRKFGNPITQTAGIVVQKLNRFRTSKNCFFLSFPSYIVRRILKIQCDRFVIVDRPFKRKKKNRF